MNSKQKEEKIQEICRQTGLSRYMLYAFYDFYGHRLSTGGGVKKKKNESLVAIVCHNESIYRMKKNPSENETKQILREYEVKLTQQVNQGKMSLLEKDEAMINHFLGWAQTSSGHFIMVYYHGISNERKEFIKNVNWTPIHKKYLAHFHTHITKERFTNGLPIQLNYTDLEETSDGKGNLSLDIRFILNKWFESAENEKYRNLLIDNRELFLKKSDYLIKLFGNNKNLSQTKMNSNDEIKLQNYEVFPLIEPLLNHFNNNLSSSGRNGNKTSHYIEDEDLVDEEDEDDPYEVKDSKYREVTKAEYTEMTKSAIHSQIHFTLENYTEISRASYISKKYIHPLSYYKHAPIKIVTALFIALNPESQAKRIVHEIALKNLLITQNNDTQPTLQFLSTDKQAKQMIFEYLQESLFSLMAVENATRNPPQHIKEAFSEFDNLVRECELQNQ